MGTTCNRK